ncbi:hypothetical protein EVAR_60418_1 [Eumeta japonica]|uniref:Uncharacterized protein n=1 Tax=Eumeta variegata TaxID=151549 RepID=A0A4C1ZGR3_EUMVA|nr:hypothetical protein EVAR_60418_1 [Eumeta japonica]
MCRDTRPTDGRRAAQDHDSLLLIEASATSSYRPIKLTLTALADKYSKWIFEIINIVMNTKLLPYRIFKFRQEQAVIMGHT